MSDAPQKIDTSPSQVATSALQAIPFGSIIGGPLSACVEAQAQAAQSTWEFIQKVGLNTDKDGNKKAVNVKFEYIQGGRKMILIVPLLTIVPIPYIAIDEIDIAFKAQISASASSATETNSSTAVDVGVAAEVTGRSLFVSGSLKMHANVSSKKDSKATQDSKYSVEYTMDVRVHAGQDSMPAGMAKVLEILNNAVDTVNSAGELSVSSNMVRSGEIVVASYRSSDGVWAPEEIEWAPAGSDDWKRIDKDNEAGEDKVMRLSDNRESVIFTFVDKGSYYIRGGECKSIVLVTAS